MAMNAELNELRPRMMYVAYRMLGTVADAEDAVQDAFLRLQAADEVTSPEGFLIRTTTRRCIDQLRANRRRKKYFSPLGTEPVDTKSAPPNSVLFESVRQACQWILERLSPDERSAFLLRTVFDYEYAQIAEVLGKSEIHVRQIVCRAKARLEQNKLRFRLETKDADGLAEQFLVACRAGDVNRVLRLFTDDLDMHSDGGSKRSTARVVIRGLHRAVRFPTAVFSKM